MPKSRYIKTMDWRSKLDGCFFLSLFCWVWCLCVLSVCKHVLICEHSSVHTCFFFLPPASAESWRVGGWAGGWGRFPVHRLAFFSTSEWGETETENTGLLHSQMLKFTRVLPLWCKHFLSESDPYIVCLLGVVGGVRKPLKSNLSSSFLSHFPPAHSSSYSQPSPLLISWSPLTPS